MSTHVPTTIPGLWHASHPHARSWLKLNFFQDKGHLESHERGMTFVGAKGNLELNQITNVTTATIIPWGGIIGAIIGNVLVFVLFWAEVQFTFDGPQRYVLLGAINLFVFTAWPWRWVIVEHIDSMGETRQDCFVEGSYLKRLTNGTKRIYDSIRQQWGQETQ